MATANSDTEKSVEIGEDSHIKIRFKDAISICSFMISVGFLIAGFFMAKDKLTNMEVILDSVEERVTRLEEKSTLYKETLDKAEKNVDALQDALIKNIKE